DDAGQIFPSAPGSPVNDGSCRGTAPTFSISANGIFCCGGGGVPLLERALTNNDLVCREINAASNICIFHIYIESDGIWYNSARYHVGCRNIAFPFLFVLQMLVYLTFPVGMFWISNQSEYFEEYVIKRKKEIFPPENDYQRKELEAFKERIRKRQEEQELQMVKE
uniref:Uncharacterized protein n=1 Tax=Varanus komodoensis TaxID=61221 RepID=A0A8D2ISZ6_VARKO